MIETEHKRGRVGTLVTLLVVVLIASLVGWGISLVITYRSQLEDQKEITANLSSGLESVRTQLIEEGVTPAVGPPAITGQTGAQGPVGPQGPQGPVGPVGPVGLGGLPGAQGPIGTQGSIGVTGLSGPQGVAGSPGSMGEAGTDGANGTDGVTGDVGPQGPIGVPGPAGTNGGPGAQGIQGPPGQSGFPFFFVVGLTRYDCLAPNTECVASPVIIRP